MFDLKTSNVLGVLTNKKSTNCNTKTPTSNSREQQNRTTEENNRREQQQRTTAEIIRTLKFSKRIGAHNAEITGTAWVFGC